MPYQEAALLIPCEAEQLIAILTRPTADVASRGSGVVIVVGGPQYRVGSHRQFVSMARALAGAGYPVLRFDVRGMGDSSGDPRGFLEQTPDIGAALDALCRETGVQRVMLWGLCDGASAALLYLHERRDPRVAGLCLLNPWVRTAQSLARAHVRHYYRQRFFERSFWSKLLRGGVARKAVRDLLNNLRAARRPREAARTASFQDRMAQAWGAFDGPVLLVLSGRDLTAKEFIEYAATAPAWTGLCDRSAVTRLDIPEADHTFSGPSQQQALERHVIGWWAQSGVIAR